MKKNPPITIPLSVPKLGGNEWTYIKKALDSGWVSSVGPQVKTFEENLASFVGLPYGVAAVNGTAALHLALLAAGVEEKDEVLVPALTFIAPVNAVRYVGAWPVFVDCDPEFAQMDVNKLERFLRQRCARRAGKTVNRRNGRRVRAVLPVHHLGHPCDMDPILALAREFKLLVIEDASESLGATYKGKPVGQFSDVACFSFNGNKIMTTGGGGMLLTRKRKIADRARYLSTQAKTPGPEYHHRAVGYNYRLTNLQAAMGLAQVEQLPSFLKKKRDIVMRYRHAFALEPRVQILPSAAWAQPSHWLVTVRLSGLGPQAPRRLVARLAARGIEARRIWWPLHRLPMYKKCEAPWVEEADRYFEDSVSIPSSVGLTAVDQGKVIREVLAFVQRQRQ